MKGAALPKRKRVGSGLRACVTSSKPLVPEAAQIVARISGDPDGRKGP